MDRRTIYVVATTEIGTRRALETASRRARVERAQLTLVAPHVVPFGAPLDRCGAEHNRCAEHYRALIEATQLDATVRVCCCHESQHVFGRLLVTGADIVIGGPRGAWRMTAEERLAEALARDGHRVVFTEVLDRVPRGMHAAAAVRL